MLLITHAGLTVSLAHVAYIHWRQDETEPGQSPRRKAQETPGRVLLVLGSGESVVAARDIPPAVARYVREAITNAWAQGIVLTDVRDLLKQYAESTPVAVKKSDGTAQLESAS